MDKQKKIIQTFQYQTDLIMTKPSQLDQTNVKTTSQNQQKQSDLKYNGEFQFYDQTEITKYFNSLDRTKISLEKSDHYANQRVGNVGQLIVGGEVSVNCEVVNVDSLLEKQKIGLQQERTNQLKAKKSSILQQLSLLDQQLSKSKSKKSNDTNLPMDSMITSKDNQQNYNSNDKINKKLVLSKEQHKQLIMKVVKQREERQKNRILFKQKQQEKQKILEEERKKNQLKRIEQQKKQKVQEIEQKLRKNKQKHQKFIQEEKESTKKFQQIKHKKFLHQQIEEKYEINIKMPLLEEQKKLLKQKRQITKAYSIDEIKNHQRAYMELRESSIKKSQAKQMLKTSRQQSYKAPQKSSRLERLLEEQKLQQKQKLMQKKRAIEQKLQRQQNYADYLKQNFSKVKIDKSKEEEIKARIQRSNTKRREEIDSRLIGLDYLQEAKKLRRKTPPKSTQQQSDSPNNKKSSNITVLSDQLKKSSSKPVSQSRLTDDSTRGNNLIKKRQQHIQNLINNKSINEAERIRKLKMETERINDAFKMKQQMLRYGHNEKVEDEAVELLLTSIHAKMGIIDIGKDKMGKLKY